MVAEGRSGDVESIGDRWLSREAEPIGAAVGDGDGGGLVPAMTRLDGPAFSAAHLAMPVRDFYERTSQRRLDAWIGWSPWAWPGGWLISTAGDRGQPGAYLVVEKGGGCWARRIPVHEVFHVHVDDHGVLRTDHRLSLGAAPVLRLHYRINEQPALPHRT